ncbi:histidine kinase dimerization/phosphoacceptor domain -containing protein [Methanobrevibacter sp.]|uniref:histidine kinase dimerization/phosphoacceptor domain -containing protein n=1 Tax=Methanobrevibacter sp. TaxID=66852 RepID=UPI00388ECB12
MNIQKKYLKLEDTTEITIKNITEKQLFHHVEPIYKAPEVPFKKVINSLPCDMNVFIPYNGGEDFVIQMLGISALERGNISPDDVEGRLLGECSPEYSKVLQDILYEVYSTHETKKLRFLYYHNDKLARLSNVKVIYDMENVVLISDVKYTLEGKNEDLEEYEIYDENKSSLIEYFSQTGSYYKINDKYSWTQGVYNIINRSREENDEYYNIVFELVIPEDRPLIDKIQNKLNSGVTNYESVIRIKTPDGIIKYLDLNFYSKFDEKGELISRYTLIKDITKSSDKSITRPVDFLLNGFKNSKKLALLIDPLNEKQYEYSEGFYNIVEEDEETYSNHRAILENIDEEDTVESFRKLLRREISELEETFVYNVKGDPNNQKICEIYIEVFEFGQEEHSIGFLTDITEDYLKQQELQDANEHQKVLIKEVHHRVKNNLQILNSFLNLEKRAYKNQPNIIIDHMQSRLSSLALLHEKTYNTSDFKNINLKEYIDDQDSKLKNLIGLRDGISFKSTVEDDITLSIEIITPLLLVVDELTMNSIKHAFPEDWPDKTITKTFRKVDANTGELIIKDNGVGMDKTKKDMKHSLGCEIIKNLTKQLDGDISYLDVEKGTGFRLLFPLTMEHTISK